MTCRCCFGALPPRKPGTRGPSAQFCSYWCRKRHRNLIDRFGITIEDYHQRLAAQGHGCANCGDVCPSGRNLAVDHDHKTGQIRGLLCVRCNVLIGCARDNPTILDYAADYLRRYP